MTDEHKAAPPVTINGWMLRPDQCNAPNDWRFVIERQSDRWAMWIPGDEEGYRWAWFLFGSLIARDTTGPPSEAEAGIEK